MKILVAALLVLGSMSVALADPPEVCYGWNAFGFPVVVPCPPVVPPPAPPVCTVDNTGLLHCH